jgi:hypothetical protein
LHIPRIAVVVGLGGSMAVLALSAAPTEATLVCPPGVTNPAYCANVPPIAITKQATHISETNATLNGFAGPGVRNGDLTTWYFQYGTTTMYGTQTPPGTVGSCPPGTTNPLYCTVPKKQKVSITIGGLMPGTTYHYQIVSTNPDGTTFGADRTFTTRCPKGHHDRHNRGDHFGRHNGGGGPCTDHGD